MPSSIPDLIVSTPTEQSEDSSGAELPGQPVRSADFLQTVIRTAAEGICVCAQSPEYPFVVFSVWNERMTELTGYTMAEINTVGWYQTVYPDAATRERAIARRERFLSGDDMRQEEWPIVRKDREPRVVAISTSRISDSDHTAAVAFVTDVTERKEVEKALRESQCRLVLAQRLARMGSWEWEIPTGKVWWSDELYRLYGREPATFEPSFENYIAAVHPEDSQLVRRQIDQILRDGEPYDLESRVVRPDGSIRWKRAQAVLDRDTAGKPRRLRGTCQDITEQKYEELSRRALEEQLLEARRLESIGVLAGGIAHEFNNLLTSILGNAELAAHQLPNDSPALAHLLPIQDAGKRAAELCRQMLAYAGKGRLVVGQVDLEKLIADATREASKKVRVERDLNSTSTLVRGDVEQLRQIATNLFTNSIDAGSTLIRVSFGYELLDESTIANFHFPGTMGPGEYAFLEIEDNGTGIDPGIQERVFEPFFTTRFPGRGLGLPVVLGVVRMHSGGLHVESKLGKGTLVRVYLPPSG